jgi:hypothetical protein
MPPSRAPRTLWPCVLLALSSAPLRGQTMDDSLMMPKNALCTGFTYQRNAWDQYWEGSLRRENGNIGKVTTQSVSWMGNYGITNRLNVIAMLPYVWTGASQGVLHGMKGVQDLTVAVKYNALDTAFTSRGSLRTIFVGSVGLPASDYTPDFLPLSIGSASRSLSGRAILHFQARPGWFVRGTGAYTWRGNVTLDRPAYYTDGELFLSDQVAMPDVFDYTASAGYLGDRLHAPVYFTQQYTRGGSDIRRQDMPFVSNRMNHSKVGASVQYWLPRSRALSVKLEANHTLEGRNVGKSTTLAAGVFYIFRFH